MNARPPFGRYLALLALLALPACGDGEVPWLWPADPGGDTGFGASTEVGFGVDAVSGIDAGPDAGGPGDAAPDVAPDGPCADVECADGQVCADGVCGCPDGTVPLGRTCVEPDPDHPLTRTDAHVCERWTADYAERAARVYTPGSGRCDPGSLDGDAHDDAMRRLNLYRWLVGLEPAGVDWGHQELAQYAAVVYDVNGAISHDLDASWTCYTPEAADAADSSNIALGYRSAAATIDGYVGDTGVPSLGHRRWCLHPDLDDVGFGHHGSGGAMWAHGSSPKNVRMPYVAYPPPGPVPASIAEGEWSFSTDRGLRGATVAVVDLSTDSEVPITPVYKDEGYGQDTIGWTMPGRPSPGDRYEVSVVAPGGEWVYEVRFVSCR